MLLLRSVSLYDVDRDVWVTPRGDIPTEILKNATGYVQLHDDHIRYCQSMKSIIGGDLTIIVILQVPSALLVCIYHMYCSDKISQTVWEDTHFVFYTVSGKKRPRYSRHNLDKFRNSQFCHFWHESS